MLQRPKALGLMICDQVIFERDTNKPTLVGMFSGLPHKQFPTTPRLIDVFTVLTDGQGKGDFHLTITNLNKDQQIAKKTVTMNFSDPLKVMNVRFRFQNVSFPEPGVYLFELLYKEEAICHRRLDVYLKEKSS